MEESQGETKSAEQINIRPWLFKKGQSGNPSGRPKGTISLKEYARKYIQDLDDEGKKEFMDGLDKETIWKMAEGNPKNDLDLNARVTIANVLEDIENGNDIQNSNGRKLDKPVVEVIGQVVADIPALQNKEQAERIGDVPEKPSPDPLPSPQVVEKYNPKE